MSKVPLPVLAAAAIVVVATAGCSTAGGPDTPGAGTIIVAGRRIPVDAPVVTWQDEGGYDAHAETCHFDPERELPRRPARGCDTARRYSRRSTEGLAAAVRAEVERNGYDAATIARRVDQVVLHYDVCGTSRRCFEVLHDIRGLSCHFLLDLDGTIYQTLDVVHRGRHATIANDRSVGVEIAHIGAYGDLETLWSWYVPDPDHGVRIRLPEGRGDGGLRDPARARHPARPALLEDVVNGRRLVQYDFTDAQYRSLAALVRGLAGALPRIRLRVPRDPEGRVIQDKLPDEELAAFSGVVGHHHVQTNKTDPGPAFDWDRLESELRE